eukprot:10243-Amphidinium_carterae.1
MMTDVGGYEQWCYSLQLPKSATVQILKTLLIHVVHITKETLVLSSNGHGLMQHEAAQTLTRSLLTSSTFPSPTINQEPKKHMNINY